ncbi:MAG: formylglycine-generating enzyme family protein [Chitinophagales bacterium]|nr:formylglycine-generating enzyme family protein [Chitinophagales bacterium]
MRLTFILTFSIFITLISCTKSIYTKQEKVSFFTIFGYVDDDLKEILILIGNAWAKVSELYFWEITKSVYPSQILQEKDKILSKSHNSRLAEYKRDKLLTINKIGRTAIPLEDMIFVKGGTFQMGSENNTNEKPVHTVTVGSFFIGRFEVTIKTFNEFINESNYKTDAEKGNGSYIYTSGSWVKRKDINWRHNALGELRPSEAFDYPVIHVSWNDAVAYCNWLSKRHGYQPVYKVNGDSVTADWTANGYRLPTEAEWEFAARSRDSNDKWAGTSSKADISSYVNFCDVDCVFSWRSESLKDGYPYASPVGKFLANSIGLHDMSGNVWEWCWDRYDRHYYQSSPEDNPTGPIKGSTRVLRGGSWHDSPDNLFCTMRINYGQEVRNGVIGFRLARNAE